MTITTFTILGMLWGIITGFTINNILNKKLTKYLENIIITQDIKIKNLTTKLLEENKE